jgi:hypothetical protein
MAGNRQGAEVVPLARNGQTNRWWVVAGSSLARPAVQTALTA